MELASSTDILRDFDLRQTKSRNELLSVFLSEERALSGTDLEQMTGKHVDRATVYRTINTFLNKGVIHKVLDDEGATKYALCRTECTQSDHHHDHVHFKCISCGSITCIDSIHIPAFNLPKDYKVIDTNLLVTGVCKSCNED